MKKVFISQPMRGKTETEILAERNRIIEEIQNLIGDHEVLDTYFDDFGECSKPLQYLAKSLWMLADADCAYFASGWHGARGCRIEHDSAVAYDVEILKD
nr:MAG TPA: N-deoxyribosyltransferase [Caudoviricetes sp.]